MHECLCPESSDESEERGKHGFGAGSQMRMTDFCFSTERMKSRSRIACAKALRPDNTGNAYKLNMNNGNMNNNDKTNSNYVRCVRENRGLFSFKNLYDSYVECRKNKRSTFNALKFEHDLEKNLIEICEKLENRTYNPKRSVCFTVLKPKPREIFAADFSDRVVQHLLVNYLEKIYEPKFIYDSYACRKKKGTHKAVKRVQSFMRKASKNKNRKAYYLQLDIKSFFMSIDKKILLSLAIRHIRDKDMIWLAEKIIFHDPTEDYLQKSPRHVREKVPKHKSLLFTQKNKGIAIGNHSSQFLANIYLDELDQFVKHELKAKKYCRYVDDFIIISESKEELVEIKEKIKAFLSEKLKLELSSKQKLLPVSNGIDFLGYVIHHDHILARRRVAGNLKEKIKTFREMLVSEKKNHLELDMCRDNTSALCSSINSYLGHLKHADAYNLINSLFRKNRYLSYFFKNFDEKAELMLKHNIKSFSGQYEFFSERLKIISPFVLLFEFQKSYAAFGSSALSLSGATGADISKNSALGAVCAKLPKHTVPGGGKRNKVEQLCYNAC